MGRRKEGEERKRKNIDLRETHRLVSRTHPDQEKWNLPPRYVPFWSGADALTMEQRPVHLLALHLCLTPTHTGLSTRISVTFPLTFKALRLFHRLFLRGGGWEHRVPSLACVAGRGIGADSEVCRPFEVRR